MKNTHIPQRKSGYALVVVMFFIAAISSFLAMLSFSSSQRSYTSQRLTQEIKAKAMAEAGCEFGYAVLTSNWEARYDPTAFENDPGSNQVTSVQQPAFSGEAYEVSYANAQNDANYKIDVEAVGDKAAMITTTGSCGSVTAVSIVTMQDIGGSNDDGSVVSGEAFEYAILCGGTFTFRGCGSMTSPSGNAKFHSNGALDNRGSTHAMIDLSSSARITSGKVTFGGDITAPSFGLHKKAKVLGTKTQTAVSTVEIPDIDLTPYYNWALQKGEVYNGYSSSSSYSPNGGILWVNGDVNLSGGTFSGTIIATGNIHISGQVELAPTDCAFAVASRDGDIQVAGQAELNGLIYAKSGSFRHNGGGEIAGQIIVNGDIHKGGNSDIMTSFASNVPSPPGGSTTTDHIAITAWQK
ncbi:MAG: hypothetical protein HKP10_09320 [Kiritimatiellales bacterium]|nr:hypothetical protein [Pontiella sp.]NNJ71468.1 hypothetical protein [Kiritimatiellales bacterium]